MSKYQYKFQEASQEEKSNFFLYLVATGDDYAKIGFVWITCFDRAYIRPRLEEAFKEDLESIFNSWKKNINYWTKEKIKS